MEEELKDFEAYTTGQMSEEERREFDRRLSAESGFQKRYNLYLDMQVHLDTRTGKEDALNSLKLVHSEFLDLAESEDITDQSTAEIATMNEQRQKKKPNMWLRLLIAILLAAIIATILYSIGTKKEEISPQALYADAFSVPAMMLNTKGPQALKEYNQRGFQAFAEGKFDLALQLLDTIQTESDPAVQSQILLAQAISYVETEDYQLSDEYFTFLRGKYPHMDATANWYEGLSWLKRGDATRAKALLKRIPSSSGYFQRAKEIQASI